MDDEVRRADEPLDDDHHDTPEQRDELFDEHVTGALAGLGAPLADTGADRSADAPQTTEWFSVEDYLALEDEVPALPRREHHVTAVVVSHDGAVWLPAVLTTLAAQTRLPDAAVGVDTGSVDASPDLLRTSFGAERTLRLDHTVGFGQAVRAGLDHLGPRTHEPFAPDAVSWVWLLHDDSAPDAHCLERLLETADDNPSVAVLGPKVLGWHDRRLLLEAGVTVTGSGRRVTGLERREHDQGQHDGIRDVLAVSSAGMLVRRDVWEALAGFDPSLPLFRDDLDFCWRAHRMGERVMVATERRHPPPRGVRPRPSRRRHRPAAAPRRPRGRGPRAARPGERARGAVRRAAAAAGQPRPGRHLPARQGRRRGARRGRRRARPRPAPVEGPLVAGAGGADVDRAGRASCGTCGRAHGTQIRQGLEAITGVLTTSGASTPGTSVSALDSGPVGEDADYLDGTSSGLMRRILVSPAFLIGAVLVVVAVIGTRGLWLGDGVLQGGALLPPPPGGGDLWETYRQAWHDVGPGSTTPAPPYLTVIAAVAFVLLGKAPAAVTFLLLLGIPLAGASAYVALRGLVPGKAIRVWAAAAYALLPAMTGAVASGRIGTTILAIVLPFTLRSLVRVSGPNGTLRRSAGTAILVAVVLSVSPAMWIVLLVGGAAGAVHLVRRDTAAGRGVLARLALALLAPVVLLLPWSAHLLAHPTLLLLEPGLNGTGITDPDLRPWDVLLLHPGGPGMTPLWLTDRASSSAGLLALLRADRLRVIGAFAILGGLGAGHGPAPGDGARDPARRHRRRSARGRARRPCSSASP